MDERFRFGRFELQPVRRQLLQDGRPVVLGARAFDLLLALIERRGRLVSKSELLDLVWPGLVVEEANLPVQVSCLRKLVGPQTIATVPGLGYRFAVPLDDDEPAAPRPAQDRLPELAVRTNVPAAIDVLLGREADIATLNQWLRKHRLVTILGAGGIGKTRLGQAVASLAADRHSDGVWWVDVAALTSTEKVTPAIAVAAQFQLGDGDALAQLVHALASRRVLLVLDNCEHLAASIAQVVGSVLAGAPNVRVLATSQEALKIDGEHLYLLSPLPVPPVGASLAEARSFAAVQLLEHRARALDARFSLSPESVAKAIDLCRHLDGVALAIEMAAARLPMLGVDGLYRRLGERLNLLRANSRDAPLRQRSLRATLDWSYELLDVNEQVVLRRLSVCVGSFTLDTARQTTGFGGSSADDMLEALSGLVEKSMVALVQHDPPRYRLTETLRLYARERLREAHEIAAANRGYMQALVSIACETEWSALPAPALLHLYAPEYEAVAQAFERAIELQDAAAASRLVLFLRSIDHLRGDFSQACARIRAIEKLDDIGDVAAAARLNYFAACCSWFRGRLSHLEAARNAVRLWRAAGEQRELYRALSVLGRVAALAGDFEEAVSAIEESARLEVPTWPARWRAYRAMHASEVSALLGDMPSSTSLAEFALKLYEEAGSRSMAAIVRLGLADSALERGGIDEATALTRMAVSELRELDQRSFLGVALVMSCRCSLESGAAVTAFGAASEALPILEQSDALIGLFIPLAQLAVMSGKAGLAARLLGHAAQLREVHQLSLDGSVRRLASETERQTRRMLGEAECHRMLLEGGRLDRAQVVALATELLSEPLPAIQPQ